MHLILTDAAGQRRLPFYLALEEWLALRRPDWECFFLWQVQPTVIIGRHQLLEKEVDTQFCRDNGIAICRRKSGGGAVLADMNNIMFSYVTSADNVTTTFGNYTSMVCRALGTLGLQANDNSRNDVLIGGRKVSGNSYYHLPGRSIVHGTMLYDFDAKLMAGALTPPTAKLESHGVSSVRSRVTTIREHLPALAIGEFKQRILDSIANRATVHSLSEADIREVELLEAPYYREEWVRGRSPRGTAVRTLRIDGAGTITAHLAVKGGRVESFELTGDYLDIEPSAAAISAAVEGVRFEREAVKSAIDAIDIPRLITGLTADHIMKLMF